MTKTAQSNPPTKSDNTPFASAFTLFAPSITVLKHNLTSFVLFLFVPLFLINLGSIVAGFSGTTDIDAAYSGIYGMLAFIGFVIGITAMPALILVQTKGARNETISPDEALAQGMSYLPRLIGLAILLVLIFAGSLLLFIVPLFFMLRRYILAPYYLIDRNLSISEALKTSAADSKKYSSAMWGLVGVESLIAIVSSLPLYALAIVGSIAGILYVNASAVRYEQIKAADKGKKPLAPVEATQRA